LKLFQYFILRVTTASGYIWNKHWNYFEIISVFYFTCNYCETEIQLFQSLKEF